MSYVNQSLGEGEIVQYVANKHWIILVVPVLQIAVALLVIGFTYKFGDLMPWPSFLLHWLGLMLLIIGALHLLYAWLTRETTELAVTNRKLIGKWGIVSRMTIEQRLDKVNSIEVEQTILGRILGYGTVDVRGSGLTMTPIP
jgi:uncharacterized membrane protein YdbT with pleckstrin-like domain